MDNKVTFTTVDKNPVTTILHNQNSLWKDVKNIDASISENVNRLKTELNILEKTEANIDITRHWYGPVDINSISESLTNVYGDLRKYIQTCGSAIRTTNDNLSHTLHLIRLLAMIEKDLYEMLDNESIQSNNFKELISDWCKKSNIRDEEVNQLLETSFQRAYTLRDRINNTRDEMRDKLRHYDSELSKLSSSVEFLKNQLEVQRNEHDTILLLQKNRSEVVKNNKSSAIHWGIGGMIVGGLFAAVISYLISVII